MSVQNLEVKARKIAIYIIKIFVFNASIYIHYIHKNHKTLTSVKKKFEFIYYLE